MAAKKNTKPAPKKAAKPAPKKTVKAPTAKPAAKPSAKNAGKPSKPVKKAAPAPKPAAKKTTKPVKPAKAPKMVKKAAAPKAAPKKAAAPKKTAAAKVQPAKAIPPSKPAPKAPVKPAPAIKPAAKAPAPKPAAAAAKPAAASRTAAKTVAKVSVPVPAPGASAAPPAGEAKKSFFAEVARPTGMFGGVLVSANPKPFPKKSPYTKAELNTLKAALVVERDRLRRELASIDEQTFGEAGGDTPGHSTHIAEYASDMQSTETNLAVRHMDEQRLAQVEEALLRLEGNQHYGLCIACGEKVGIERLAAKPHAQLCMDCRKIYEKKRR